MPREAYTFKGLAIYQVKLVGIEDDTLVCLHVDPEGRTQGASVRVAKPYLLRRTPFDSDDEGEAWNGITYTYSGPQQRQADGEEDQIVVPAYVVGDLIYVVQVSPGVLVYDPSGDAAKVSLLDLNVDGRAWAQASS